MAQAQRSCATCNNWSAEAGDSDYGQCTWEPHEALPFWADIDRGSDHADATQPTDGARCQAWVLATGLARG